MRLLAADIGGTNTRFLSADLRDGSLRIDTEKSYPSTAYAEFQQVLHAFLDDSGLQGKIDAACLAVAGPVQAGVVSVTNLPWVIRETDVQARLNTPKVKLINDFSAVGYGVGALNAADLLVIQEGAQQALHPEAAIIGAGTGLGIAHRVWRTDHYQVLSSEAGHVGFAPETPQQTALLSWLQQHYAHVSVEMLLSGSGLLLIYQYLHATSGITASASIQQAMQQNDPAQVITQYALTENDALCQLTLAYFVEIYGAAAGNAALYYYPVQEVYIAGGIAQKIKSQMTHGAFTAAFCNKGPLSANMKQISIKLILQEKVGLYGALAVLREQ
ncbi:MAG: glucokinase [Gammaproteobacteria bacterium]